MSAAQATDVPATRVAPFAAVLLIPAVAGAIVGVVLAVRAGTGARVTAARAAQQFAVALEEEDLSRAHAAILAGVDPNALVAFTHPELTGDEPVLLSPLAIASATEQENMVRMLLASGVRPDDAENRAAWCVAEGVRVREVLEPWIAENRPQCPAPRSDKPRLRQLRDHLGHR